MTCIRKPQTGQSIAALDRELILKGAQNTDEMFKFKDSEGTPQRDAIMKRIKELYASASTSSSNETISQIDTWGLARALLYKIRKKGREENRNRGIWYEDHRMDYFGITDEKVRKNADSVAAVIFPEALIEEKNSMSRINVKNYGEVFNLWEGEKFRDQPIAAGKICTGFLVEKDVIATAAHIAKKSNVENLRFVFGYRMLSPKMPVTRVPGKDIYKGTKIKAHVLNRSDGTDYALVQLDRQVEGRDVLKLSPAEISRTQDIYILGHPCGLPLKYSPGAKVRQFNENFFAADLDVYMRNSGSPVFSMETHEVIGMLVRGDTRDFRWTGKGWASVVYPNQEIEPNMPQCTRASRFFDKVK
jgi:V8-like Glu-specific endopeptidase